MRNHAKLNCSFTLHSKSSSNFLWLVTEWKWQKKIQLVLLRLSVEKKKGYEIKRKKAAIQTSTRTTLDECKNQQR